MEVEMDRKKQILRLIHYTQTCIMEYADQIGEEDRLSTGRVDHWTAKDHLAHISHWKGVFNHRLEKREKQDKPVTDIDRENAKVFEHYRDKKWAEVIGMMEKADEDFSHQVKMLSEEEMNSSSVLPGIMERPLWQSLVGNGCTHALSHLGQLYVESGHPEKAVELQERILEDLQSLDESKKWRGTNIYNLACACAIAGQSNRAIVLLKEALHLHPELTEWSTHDPDFNGIRELDEYKQIYAVPV
jgi:tetratricopeptide (TPR) repeat protein